MHGSKKGGKELVWEDKDVHAFNDGVNIQGDVCNIKIEPNHWKYCYQKVTTLVDLSSAGWK